METDQYDKRTDNTVHTMLKMIECFKKPFFKIFCSTKITIEPSNMHLETRESRNVIF